MANLAVIGAGIAGLGAAYRLRKLGHTVTVYEKDPQVGGRMRTSDHNGFRIDHGAQFIASGYKNILALSKELNIHRQIHPLSRTNNAILRGGQFLAGDYDSPLALLTHNKLLSTRSRMRLPLVIWDMLRNRKQIHHMSPRLAAPLDNESLPDYARRRFGEEAYDFFIQPAVSGTFVTHPDNLSKVFLLQLARFTLGGFHLLCFDGGIGLLNQTLAAQLDVRLNTAAKHVSADETHATVVIEQAGETQTLEFDGVVMAVPGPIVPTICYDLSPRELLFFQRVRYSQGIIVYLLLDEIPDLPYYGISFPLKEGLGLYGLALDHVKYNVTPEGKGLLNVCLTEKASLRLWDGNDDAIVSHVLNNLAKTPIGKLKPADVIIHRWSPMLPQFYTGYTKELDSFYNTNQRQTRIVFAGDYLVGPYTEAALNSGMRGADLLHSRLG
jgi:oxygen-dependent protoporphyrinogen oxidase